MRRVSALLVLASANDVAGMAIATATARIAAQELCAWVNEKGGSAHNVVCGPTQHGLGLLAAEALEPGDVAVSIPSSCLLSAEFARESPELLALHDEVPEEFWAARLALVLLAERSKGDAGALAPYMRTLPASFTVPLLWSPEAVKLLQYQPVQSALLKSAKLVGSFASEQLAQAPSAFGVRAVDANAFGWAVAACSSRAFRVGGGARALCPIIDLGNHAPREEATCEVRGTLGGKVELVAKRGIELGEEVTYCYGELSNDAFLLDCMRDLT
jgi:hypothetical protein